MIEQRFLKLSRGLVSGIAVWIQGALENVNDEPLKELVSIHEEKVSRALELKLLSPSTCTCHALAAVAPVSFQSRVGV